MQTNSLNDFRLDFAKELPPMLIDRTPAHNPASAPVQPATEKVRVSSATVNRRWIWSAVIGGVVCMTAVFVLVAHSTAIGAKMPVERLPIADVEFAPAITSAPVAPSAPGVASTPEMPAVSTESSTAETGEKENDILPTDRIEISYAYVSATGKRIETNTYAKRDGDGYAFYRTNDTPITSAIYAHIGSPSQPALLVYESADQSAAGIIAGMRASSGEVYYGVLSLYPLEWIISCKYEDIYIENGRYIGDIPQGSSQDLSYVPARKSADEEAVAVEDAA